MNTQTPLALPPPAGTAYWNRPVLFDERRLAALAGVNAAFLRLLRDLHGSRPGMPALGLPAHLVIHLTAAAEALKGPLWLPFVLFDASFRDEAFWQASCAATSAVRDGGPSGAAEPRVVSFARSAVTLAWHCAQLDSRLARMAFGLEPAAVAALADLPVGRLEGLARRVAPVLTARFCVRERFWNLLAAAGRSPSDEALAGRVRLLGLQLHGSDAARVRRLHRRQARSAQP